MSNKKRLCHNRDKQNETPDEGKHALDKQVMKRPSRNHKYGSYRSPFCLCVYIHRMCEGTCRRAATGLWSDSSSSARRYVSCRTYTMKQNRTHTNTRQAGCLTHRWVHTPHRGRKTNKVRLAMLHTEQVECIHHRIYTVRLGRRLFTYPSSHVNR